MNRGLIRFHHAKPTVTHPIRPKGCGFLRRENRSLGVGARCALFVNAPNFRRASG
ncbi:MULTISPECIES: hypothetical protein [unclassified Nostoc]|uniref:hypothetical protein n=1 Tax=unclassified Nostoc TaxID=2593658 RepID=UPI0025E2FEB7|nr:MULTISPECIES: hypothetical protein [unclassified Nostoc]